MKLFLVLIVATFPLSFVSAQESLRIGVSTALTGEASTYGNDMRNAFLFANEKLTSNRYQLIFEDDRCSGKDAVTVAHRFIDILKVPYVLGFACSGTVFPTAPMYSKANVVVMISSASAAGISKLGEYVYRTWPSDDGAAKALYSHVKKSRSSIGIISEQTDYAQGLSESFKLSNADSALQIVEESYLPGATDFRSSLLRLKQRNVEGLFINSQTEMSFVAILRQVKEMRWAVPIYGAYWPGTSAVLDKVPELAEGIEFVDLPNPESVLTEAGKPLYAEYLHRYGKPSSIELLFATSYEAFRALTQAIESGEDLRAYLSRTTFHGIFGDWSFDKNGEIVGMTFVMKVIRGGQATALAERGGE